MAVSKGRVIAYQSPLHPDQVLSRVQHVQFFMHNIKFTRLKLFEVAGDFDLAEECNNAASYT